MKVVKVFIAIAIVFLVQTMVLAKYNWVRSIDLFLLLNIYFALGFNQMTCMFISIPTGLLQDAFTGGILGYNAFSKTIIAFLISGLSSRLMLKHPLVIMLLIFAATVIDLLIFYGLHGLFRLPVAPFSLPNLLTAGLLNALVGILTFQIADHARAKKEYA